MDAWGGAWGASWGAVWGSASTIDPAFGDRSRVVIIASKSPVVTRVEALDVEQHAPLIFDFTQALDAQPITIDSVEVTAEVRSGRDGLVASAFLQGEPIVDGARIQVAQWVRSAEDSIGYAVRCVAQCSDGRERVGVASLFVKRL